MSSTAALVLALVVAGLVVAAMSKPKKSLFSAVFTRGKKGRFGLSLTPVTKPKRRRRRK